MKGRSLSGGLFSYKDNYFLSFEIQYSCIPVFLYIWIFIL